MERKAAVALEERLFRARSREYGARVAEATTDRMSTVERLDRPAVAARATGPGALACATESKASAALTNSGASRAASAPRVGMVRVAVMTGTVGGASNRPETGV